MCYACLLKSVMNHLNCPLMLALTVCGNLAILKITLDYIDGQFHDDICVIMTDEIFDFGTYVRSVDLDQFGCNVASQCIVSGWGLTQVRGHSNNKS